MPLFSFDPLRLALSLPGMIIALSFHEWAHARMAVYWGDETPRRAGRLTLEPWAHLDPIGTLALVFFRFGWAKPVPTNPFNYRNLRAGYFWTAFAGPLMNILLGLVFALLTILIELNFLGLGGIRHLDSIMVNAAVINLGLAVFNLLPVPPLDGSKIVTALLPRRLSEAYANLDMYGSIFLILILSTNIDDVVLIPALKYLIGVTFFLADKVATGIMGLF